MGCVIVGSAAHGFTLKPGFNVMAAVASAGFKNLASRPSCWATPQRAVEPPPTLNDMSCPL